jgi:hypothetical protein
MAIWHVVLSPGILSSNYVRRLLTGPEFTTWLSPLMGAWFTTTAIAHLLRWPQLPSGHESLGDLPMVTEPPLAQAA